MRPLSSDDANLCYDLICPEHPSQTNSRDILLAVLAYEMAAVNFLHHENPNDLGRGRTRNLRYGRQATNQPRH
ncbi:hypothetical protein TNCV_808121 [Trichonephila clavipes]|nr:hypothetical protein TNCV_808121 [Trichonephila clavipes]